MSERDNRYFTIFSSPREQAYPRNVCKRSVRRQNGMRPCEKQKLVLYLHTRERSVSYEEWYGKHSPAQKMIPYILWRNQTRKPSCEGALEEWIMCHLVILTPYGTNGFPWHHDGEEHDVSTNWEWMTCNPRTCYPREESRVSAYCEGERMSTIP